MRYVKLFTEQLQWLPRHTVVGCSKQNFSYLAMKSCALQVPTLALPRSIWVEPMPWKEKKALFVWYSSSDSHCFRSATASRSLELTHRYSPSTTTANLSFLRRTRLGGTPEISVMQCTTPAICPHSSSCWSGRVCRGRQGRKAGLFFFFPFKRTWKKNHYCIHV